MASPTLVSFAKKQGLYDPARGEFDFHQAYSQDNKNDTTYNYPRVWTLQHQFNPHLDTVVSEGETFSVFNANNEDQRGGSKNALRNHYQGTSHDPYASHNPQEPWRPISVFRTRSHIFYRSDRNYRRLSAT